MSSDSFYIRPVGIEGTEVTFDALTGTAGGLQDLMFGRSFVLVALSEAPRFEGSALAADLANAADDWFVNARWMQEHVGRFVHSTELLERRNNVGTTELSRRLAEIVEQCGGTLRTDLRDQWEPLMWERCHSFSFKAVMADAKYAAHLEPGKVFGTTAFDVWGE